MCAVLSWAPSPRIPTWLKRIGAIGVIVLSVGACAPDPLGDCVAVCRQEIEWGCRDPMSDCEQMCRAADVVSEYEENIAIADEASCRGEFEALYTCRLEGNVCDPTRCLAEVESRRSCLSDYCKTHSASFCP